MLVRRDRGQHQRVLRDRGSGGDLPLRRRRRRDAARAARTHWPDRARLPARHQPRAALRVPRARAVGSRATACAATRTSCSSTRTPAPSRGTCSGTKPCSGTASDDPGRRATTPTARPSSLAASSSTRTSTGTATSLLRTPLERHGHLRGARQGRDAAATPTSRRSCRGTYAGIAHPAFVEHLTTLGITALELLPVHQFVHDAHLVEQGLRNYWGYNSIGFFAPHNEYATAASRGEQVQDFKQMVKVLHSAGIEVILDVVYNHTAEGNHLGPTLSFKGIDNAAYYRLVDDDRRYYMDYTGTGNSLNMRNPYVLQLVMDSLRYWVTEMHVDGFRFDLAVDAGPRAARGGPPVGLLRPHPAGPDRQPGEAHRRAVGRRRGRLPGRQLPAAVGGVERQVPRLRARLLARRGRRRLGEFAYRLTGSSDLYEDDGRRPHASINFVTAHDGFTLPRPRLATTTSTTRPTARTTTTATTTTARGTAAPKVRPTTPRSTRCAPRQQRNLLTTLLLSQGIPMLLGGDEIGRTQQGNNNAYCQDNEISWFDWETRRRGPAGVHPRLIAFRHDHPVLRRRTFFQGRPIHGEGVQRHRVVHTGRRRDGRARLGGRIRQVARGLPQRRRTRDRAGGARSTPTTASCCCSTPTTSPSCSPSRHRVGVTTGSS